jgi:hypothetical protein
MERLSRTQEMHQEKEESGASVPQHVKSLPFVSAIPRQ